LKFLTDENIFPQVITFLRKLGHDVKDIQESGLYLISDDKIVEIATHDI
jgi:predicted nuclease of predicted toxin-antitoxin system